jgi:toxin-antitoxin system PIN domain toxin
VILPDVNVLIYAFRQDAPHHGLCRPWLEAVLNDEAKFALSLFALSAVVRITTQTKTLYNPSTLDEAFRFCAHLVDRPNCQIVEPTEKHWGIFKRLCVETNTRGRHVTDAWYAALAIEWGCEWITMDRDFARFPGLKWSMPAV